MQTEGPRTPYEVYCNRCRVSFALGTKRCIHCGDRPTRGRERPELLLPPLLEAPHELAGEEISRRGSRISPVSILWIVAALAVGLQRACAT
jgi:hypothetical protein